MPGPGATIPIFQAILMTLFGRFVRRGVFAIGAALIMAACQRSTPPDPTGSWRLVSLEGQTSVQGAGGRAPTLTLAGTQASGFGGCNRYTGGVTVDGTSMRFGAVASTRMACVGGGDAVEQAYYAMLAKVTTFARRDRELALNGPDGRLAIFVRE